MDNRRCPECQATGHDTGADHGHLFLMSDGETWACTHAEYHESGVNYYERVGTTPALEKERGVPFMSEAEYNSKGELVGYEKSYIDTLPQDQFIRDINPDVLVKYGVHFEVDGSGSVDKHFYPTHSSAEELLGYEVRTNPKGFFKTFKVGEQELHLGGFFARDSAKPEHLVICEGYLDAMMTYQVLKSKGVRNFHVVSLQNGNSIKSLRDNLVYLHQCYNLYLYPDQDEAGAVVVKELSALMPKVKILRTSEKDACDMHKAGKDEELFKAFKAAKRYKPPSIILPSEAKEDAFKPVEWGLEYPFMSLTNLTYGLRSKRVISIAAGPGAGKTQFIKSIQCHLVFEHNEMIGVFSMEESPGEAMRELAGYVMNKPLDRPDTIYDPAELSKVLDSFEDNVVVYDPDNYEKWSDIEEAIRYMASCGVKWIFIDPLSVLTVHLSASEQNQYLGEAMYRMSRLVKSLDITIFNSNHLNNSGGGGKDHGEGGSVKASQMTGSRAQWKFSTDVWGLERDQYADDEEERNTTKFVNLKYRKPSRAGSFQYVYDEALGTLAEPKVKY